MAQTTLYSPVLATDLDPLAGPKAAQVSLVLGIVGLFFVGWALGPLSIAWAREAQKHHYKATAGLVLGILSTLFGVVGLFMFLIVFHEGWPGSTAP